MNRTPRSFFCAIVWRAILLMLLGLGIAQAQFPTRLNISLVASNKPPQASSGFGDVWGDGNIACLGVWTAYSTFGFGIYNIANPASPQLLTVYNFSANAQNRFEQGVIRSNILYVGSWGGNGNGSGLHILSLANPASPVLLSRITANSPGTVVNGFNDVHTLFLERNFLYLAAHNVGILSVKVFDVSNPALPVYVRDIVSTNTTKVHQMTVRNKGGQVLLYTSGWGGNDNGAPDSPGQTDIWDVTQVGAQPAQWLGRIYAGYNSHSSWPSDDGNTLVVCREMPGGDVKLYDITNPGTVTSNTAPLVTITPASMGLETDIPHNPVIISNYLFLSWYQNGLQIFDITDRTKPVRVGYYDTYPGSQSSSYQGNWGIYPHLGFNKLLVSDIQGGFLIMDATAVLTPTNNYPPMIIKPPLSLTVTQGADVVFAPVVTGSLLKYQWRLNGSPIAGATTSSLIFSNVQPVQAGNYSVVVSNASAAVTSATASLSVGITETSQTPFFDNFDSTASSNNWDLFEGSGNGTPDYTADWFFDYGTYFSAFNGTTIPPAPNSTNGTTRGLKLTVNKDGVAATAAVSVYPRSKSFSGAYKLKCDMWLNYPGDTGGGTGSTEFGMVGLNHANSRVNWQFANPSDGVWFAVDGEGGTSTSGSGDDYRAYVGNLAGTPATLSAANGGFTAVGAASRDSSDPYWQSIFPAFTYETAGTPGKKWVQVEIGQDTNSILTWRINGNLIARRTNTSAFTSGDVMLGYMDSFSSIASPAADAFVVFDNVRVEIAGTSAPPVIAIPPQNVSVYPGEDATFSVAATGSGALYYQWLFNGSIISGATNNTYIRAHVQPEDVGSYSVVVSNNVGFVVSSDAALLLIDSPYVNAVQAAPGVRSALISWNTTVAGDSQVQFDATSFVVPGQLSAAAAAQGSFSQTTYRDSTPTTRHVILLTGLQPGTRYSYQTLSSEGTNTYVSGVYQFTTAGSIIVDNGDAAYTGSWTEGTISSDKYSTNYQYTTTVGGGATATATWRPNIITPGKYDVSIWYPQGGNRAPNAPFLISYNGGSTNALINQQNGGGSWQVIAAGVDFAKGTNGFVRLANNANPSVVIADAVKFDYVEAQDFPIGPTAPTWWQDFFFGGTIDPTLDPDGDGYTTAQEYVMGTVPTNSASHLELSSQAMGTNGAGVTFWPLLGNRSYTLVYRPIIGDPTWQLAPGGAMTSTLDGYGSFLVSTTNGMQSYFRLKVQMNAASVLVNNRMSLNRSVALGYVAEATCGPYRVYVRPRE